MELKIDSDALNNIKDVCWTNDIPIYLNNDPRKVIGSCKIKLNKINGRLYAHLNLQDDISTHLYVYFYDKTKPENNCKEIVNVSLHQSESDKHPTKFLDEMIVE
ncbi:MAG: hypothetical protein Q8891_17605 [Bacteroidota bacterium]|nr:hypothetical protein [Bacteroidota bacterium]